MYDLLLSSDMMVRDPDGLAETFVGKLGAYSHPRWRQAFPNHAYVAHFLRVNMSRAVAPTTLEPQGHLDKPNEGDPFFHDFLKSLEDFQGRRRPMKTHATVIVAEDVDRVLDRLHRRRVPFRLAQTTPEMPWERFWIGSTPENVRYDPSWDGGLCIEFIPTWSLRLPEEAFASPTPEPVDPKPGEMVRVVGRGFIVRDLDETVRKLSENLEMEPSGPIEDVPGEGYRRARYGFRLAQSATLDLIEPTRWNSDAGVYMHNWGPGPYYTRISVHGMDAKADDLKRRGTNFTLHPDSDAVGGRPILRVDPADLQGHLFEFVEHAPAGAS